jgi:hypothetical protein
MRSLGFLCCVALAAGCGSNRTPTVQPIADKNAFVGVELLIEVRATDPDGDTIAFDFEAPTIPDLKTRAQKATLSAFSDGVGQFRWTPTAADRGATYPIDFKALDGKGGVTTETVQITVKDASDASAPIFRKPLGTGTTLDLEKSNCVSVEVVTEDPDSTMVTIGEEDPTIEGAMLDQTGPFEATWSWCPTNAQIAAQDRYMLTLSADDGENPKSKKGFLIVLRQKPMTGCPGAAPAITHTPPAAATTNADITLTATISDDVGLKGSPLVYYAETAPASPIDLSKMVQVSMMRTAGTAQSGTYTGKIPNPVAASPAGTMKTLYYLIIADDNDDVAGTCDHSTRSPATGTHTTTVTAPVTTPGFGVCEACTSDAQCGGADDHCITVGTMNETFCGRACGGAFPNCPTGYNCTVSAVTSVDGKSARQCKPTVGYCGPPPVMCTDDTYEQNDSRTSIPNVMSASMMPGTYTNLAFCPAMAGGADEDWYGVPVAALSRVKATATFLVGAGEYADIDLQLTDSTGTILSRGYLTESPETVRACHPAGKAFVRVFTFDSTVKENLYDFAISVDANDVEEPNNDLNAAKGMGLVLNTEKVLPDMWACAGDEDWYLNYLTEGQKLTATLVFEQSAATQDLDLFLFKEDSAAAGGVTQVAASTGAVAGEKLVYTIPTGGTEFYHIVVKGKTATAGNAYTLKALKE